MTYRIRYYSDGGPVTADNVHGWPVASHSYRTLFSSMKALRDAVNSDSRIGTVLGVSLQYRVSGGQWITMSTREIDKTAAELNLRNWKPLCAAVTQ